MWKLGTLWFSLRKQLALAWATLRDPRTPVASKLTIVAALLYVLSPVDLVSDLLPVLGWLDDGVVAVLLLGMAQRLLPAELQATLREQVARRGKR